MTVLNYLNSDWSTERNPTIPSPKLRPLKLRESSAQFQHLKREIPLAPNFVVCSLITAFFDKLLIPTFFFPPPHLSQLSAFVIIIHHISIHKPTKSIIKSSINHLSQWLVPSRQHVSTPSSQSHLAPRCCLPVSPPPPLHMLTTPFPTSSQRVMLSS